VPARWNRTALNQPASCPDSSWTDNWSLPSYQRRSTHTTTEPPPRRGSFTFAKTLRGAIYLGLCCTRSTPRAGVGEGACSLAGIRCWLCNKIDWWISGRQGSLPRFFRSTVHKLSTYYGLPCLVFGDPGEPELKSCIPDPPTASCMTNRLDANQEELALLQGSPGWSAACVFVRQLVSLSFTFCLCPAARNGWSNPTACRGHAEPGAVLKCHTCLVFAPVPTLGVGRYLDVLIYCSPISCLTFCSSSPTEDDFIVSTLLLLLYERLMGKGMVANSSM